jgi:xanthine dehydrogenase small subunit
MSLAGFCLSDKEASDQNAIAAIDGNICRCTGINPSKELPAK